MKNIITKIQGALKLGLCAAFVGVAIFAFSPRQAQAFDGRISVPVTAPNENVCVEMTEYMC